MVRKHFSNIIICGSILITALIIHFLSNIIRKSIAGKYNSHQTLSQLVDAQSREYSWMIKLMLNCLGYSCVFVPGYFIYKYVQRTDYLETADRTCIYSIVSLCMTGSSKSDILINDGLQLKTSNSTSALTASASDSNVNVNSSDAIKSSLSTNNKLSSSREFLLLLWCFCGLMLSYLTWGVLQEKIMTQEYYSLSGKVAYFKDSQFLVFTNRTLSFVLSIFCLQMRRPNTHHKTPLYKYAFASFSNIMSAWFQYEALKFVNFPTQVLAKSCKIIPVMIMGKILMKNKYEFYEYLTAVLISLGMICFMTGSSKNPNATGTTTMTGVFLLTMYMVFDSFTANWQGALFKTYKITPLQMMCGVNLFSTIFTAASLRIQDGFIDSITFATEHPKFIFDTITLSVSSVVGQLFIFYTISVFGPVVFAIIMTLRQAVAILLSCLIYHHNISPLGVFGVVIVFLAIFLRVYCNQRLKQRRRRAEAYRTKMAV